MSRNRLEEADYRLIADELGVPVSEVSRAVNSFFGIIVGSSRSLPFDNDRKIFTREKFREYETAWNIPYIGRIGPVYSRYLKWRANEAKNLDQVTKRNCQKEYTQGEIEKMAEEALSGKIPSLPEKKKGSDLFNRVWLVGKDGKKSARQVIPKKNK